MAHPQDTAQIEQVTVNCTVMYVSQCMSGSKCKATCISTGAAAYRWFFDGCCECVGSSCINYGVNESRLAHSYIALSFHSFHDVAVHVLFQEPQQSIENNS